MTDHIPPHDEEAELAVLGAMLLVTDAADAKAIMDVVVPADFYRTPHSRVFAAQMDLWETKYACDPLLLRSDLQENGALAAVGGTNFISRIVAGVPSSANAVHYANIVRKKALEREVLEASRLHEAAQRDNGNGLASEAFQRLTRARFMLEEFDHPTALEQTTWDYADTAADEPPPPPAQVVSRLFTRNSTNIVFGASGSGKSWTIKALAIDAVMGGGNFMGSDDLYIVPLRELRDGRDDTVLWLFGSEDTKDRVNSRIRKVHKSGPHADKSPRSGAIIYGKRPRLTSLKTMRGAKWLESLIKKHRPTILVLDTVRSLCPDLSVNDSAEVMPFMDMMNSLRDRYNLTTFLVHHTRKSGTDPKKSEASAADSMLGSETWRSQADGVLMIDAKDGNTLDVRCRLVKSKDLEDPVHSWRASFDRAAGRFHVLDEDEEAPKQETVQRSPGGRPKKFTADAILALRSKFPDGLPWNVGTVGPLIDIGRSQWFERMDEVSHDLLTRGCAFVQGSLLWQSEK